MRWVPVPRDDYNARLYDPSLGRFLSVDPLIGHPGSTQGINPYSYVANNPLNKTDPTGEMSCTPSGAGKTVTCTNTPLGSRIPQKTTVKVGSNGKVTTSGAGALPDGGIAMSTDGTSSLTISSAGRQSQGTTGQNPQKTADHTKINDSQSASAGGDMTKLVEALKNGMAANITEQEAHKWNDIYTGKRKGATGDWVKIFKTARAMAMQLNKMSNAEFSAALRIPSDADALDVRAIRTSVGLQLMNIQLVAGGKIAEFVINSALKSAVEIAISRGGGRIIGSISEEEAQAFEKNEIQDKLLHEFMNGGREMNQSPVLSCGLDNSGVPQCGLGN